MSSQVNSQYFFYVLKHTHITGAVEFSNRNKDLCHSFLLCFIRNFLYVIARDTRSWFGEWPPLPAFSLDIPQRPLGLFVAGRKYIAPLLLFMLHFVKLYRHFTKIICYHLLPSIQLFIQKDSSNLSYRNVKTNKQR